jgi:glycosyltransferase involved in cell wall biosynthesis
MMERPPKISIVTSSFNQGRFIERTIQSVMAQSYPNLEHIVVDGMSSDETVAVLARYPHLHVIREPDSGQAEAINKGFRVATGEIFGYLNSDDTLEPGALDRVAREIDPAAGRHVIVGRCRFIDEHDRFAGVEHPSGFESHRRVLEIWKGHLLPQPAIFWTPAVWQRCGPLDEREHLMLDYDLFCRFSREYVFHPVDQILAHYRLHTESKTGSVDDAQRLEESIRVSRRFWGPWTSLQFWRILASYTRFRLDRRHRASRLLVAGRADWQQKRRGRAVPRIAAGALLGPEVALDVLLVPVLKPGARAAVARTARLLRTPDPRPQTQAWRDFSTLHADGWAGPRVILPVEVESGQSAVVVVGKVAFGRLPRPLEIEGFLDGRPVGRHRVGRARDFSVRWPLGDVSSGAHELQIVSNAYTVPHDLLGNQDFRPLSFRLEQLSLISEAQPTA